ncbi:MAG TPA: hypothetical protein VKZ18_02455 [Polyangia bacterium]|nr:hypothetical protein [Polyangia bacterium]
MASRRRGGFLRLLVITLVLAVAAGGVLYGPRIAAAVRRDGGVLQAAKRKLTQLHDFALFRSKGDKAVLRWGEPPKGHGKKVSAH